MPFRPPLLPGGGAQIRLNIEVNINTLAGTWAGGTQYGVNLVLLIELDGEDLRITRFLQKSLHTNPFRKIPDYNSQQFTIFKEYFTKSVGPGQFSAENLKVI